MPIPTIDVGMAHVRNAPAVREISDFPNFQAPIILGSRSRLSLQRSIGRPFFPPPAFVAERVAGPPAVAAIPRQDSSIDRKPLTLLAVVRVDG
jgi:hypothetical protein